MKAGADEFEPIDIDALVRGPVDALGLTEDLETAQRLLTSGDSEAIDAFRDLAEQLRAKHFAPHATTMFRVGKCVRSNGKRQSTCPKFPKDRERQRRTT